MPIILMGDDTHVKMCRRGSIDVGKGTFEDILCVPPWSTNFSYIYQINHIGYGNPVEFTLDVLVISKMCNRSIVVVAKIDHQSKLY